MNSFSADWLQLREPVDALSRAGSLAALTRSQLRPARPAGERVQIVDLGAGTGSNLRYLAPFLGGSQDWLLVEQDGSLLGAMPERMRTWINSRHGRSLNAGGALHLRSRHSTSVSARYCSIFQPNSRAYSFLTVPWSRHPPCSIWFQKTGSSTWSNAVRTPVPRSRLP